MVLGVGVWARLAAFPVFVLVIPLRCSLVAPLRDTGAIGPSAATPKQEEPRARIESVPPPAPRPAVRPIALADEVVVRALDAGQQAFLRCWARAQRSEVPPETGKVRLHLELDDQGHVTAATSDSDAPALASCLAVVARRLPFPAPGQPAVVDVPLMFR
ncbi:MAG TPA: hypothetical protein VGD37_19620 [Kofleriaceae bacterium]|jgi:hypothetical protein